MFPATLSCVWVQSFTSRDNKILAVFLASCVGRVCLMVEGKIGGDRERFMQYGENLVVPSSSMYIMLFAYLLAPCSTVLLEKLTDFQPVKKFPAFYGSRRFITQLTSSRHLSLSWASSIQSITPHPTSCRSILISSSHLRLGLPSGLFPSGFSTKTLYMPLLSPYVLHASPISFFSILSPEKYLVRSTDH